jgi:hypothetical protein
MVVHKIKSIDCNNGFCWLIIVEESTHAQRGTVHAFCYVVYCERLMSNQRTLTKFQTDNVIVDITLPPVASYTGCPRKNVPNFGRVFLMLKYTDITQNTYIQSWTVTEIMAREKYDLLAVPRTVPALLTRHPYTAHARPWEFHCCQLWDCVMNS